MLTTWTSKHILPVWDEERIPTLSHWQNLAQGREAKHVLPNSLQSSGEKSQGRLHRHGGQNGIRAKIRGPNLVREPDVTTIIGICCTDGLVIGSDSKATKGPSMREEYLKIWDLDVEGFPAVITGAGRSAFIAKYRDLLQGECAGHHGGIQSVAEFVQVAERAMQDMTRQYGTERMARLGLLGISSGDENRTPRHSAMDLFPELVAVVGIHDEEPQLFFITPDGVAEEQQRFGAEGSGGPYADYLLPKLCGDELSVAEAVLCAVHIIEQVKHVDPHSGGKTRIAVVTKSGAQHWTQAEITEAAAEITKIEQKTSELWRKSVKAQGKAFKSVKSQSKS